jgi:hypothetical protein
MTPVKEKTVELIKRLPDEQVVYVFNILNNIEELAHELISSHEHASPQTTNINETVLSDKQKAYQNLLKYKGSLPADFDYEKELAEAKEEKYGRIG